MNQNSIEREPVENESQPVESTARANMPLEEQLALSQKRLIEARDNVGEHNESELKQPDEVWFIDDNTEYNNTLSSVLTTENIRITGFSTARTALDSIGKLIEQNKPLPSKIFVDGNLDDDEKELSSGENVVSALCELFKSAQLQSQPTLIGWSSMEEKNEKMLQSGAQFAFPKGPKLRLADIRTIVADPQKYKEEHPDNKKD